MSRITDIEISNTSTENVLTPFREILPTDTFNDWRRKTNGLNSIIEQFAEGVNDSTITVTTSNGLTGASDFTLNQDADKNINLAVDTTVIASKTFVSNAVGNGTVSFVAGNGIKITGGASFNLNDGENKQINISFAPSENFDLATIIDGAIDEADLHQWAVFIGDGDRTNFDLASQEGFEHPSVESAEPGPQSSEASAYIVTIDGVYQIPERPNRLRDSDGGGFFDSPSVFASYYIDGNNLVFYVAPPASSKISISSVISYNPTQDINVATIGLEGVSESAITGGGTFNLNQSTDETISFGLNIDEGLLTQTGGILSLSNLSPKLVLGNLSPTEEKPGRVEVDSATDGLTANDTRLATSAAIKNYVDDNGITQTTGSAPYYGCRAWASYNGSDKKINASGNISSIVRNSAGNYTVNFGVDMPDANYAVTTGSSADSFPFASYISAPRIQNKTKGSFLISVYGGGPLGSSPDNAEISFAVFR